MLIRPAELDAIRDAAVDLAFRRWERPRLRVGTRMRTSVGLVEVTSVDRVTLAAITLAEARRAGAASRKELVAMLAARPDHPIFRVGLRYAGPDPRIALRAAGELSSEERERLLGRLDRLDASSTLGPWTRATLAIIGRLPETRAGDLAQALGRERLSFKRDVRKLKEMGLTESLDIGYRLSARGRALLDG